MLEGFLDVAQSSSEHDIICQSVIILMGSLAKHFDKDDPKVCNYPLQYFSLNCELSIIFFPSWFLYFFFVHWQWLVDTQFFVFVLI